MKSLITAHSGCEGTAPNSIEHIKSAIASGADFIEIDVRKSAEGYLYLYHDKPEDPSECVRFSDFLDLLADSWLCVNNDMKEPGLVGEVMKAADEKGLASRMYFTGEANDSSAEIQKWGNEFVYSIWSNGNDIDLIKETLDKSKELGFTAINMPHGMINDETYKMITDAGCNCSAWTCDSEDVIRRMLEYGIRNITTRKPSLAVKLRSEIQK